MDKYGKDGVLEGDHRFKVHLLAKWAHEIVTPPALVSAVKPVLDCPNILCWSSDINIKPAKSRNTKRSANFQNPLNDFNTNNNRIFLVENVLRKDLHDTWENSNPIRELKNRKVRT